MDKSRKRTRQEFLRDTACRLRREGYTYGEIAQQLGISRKQANSLARPER